MQHRSYLFNILLAEETVRAIIASHDKLRLSLELRQRKENPIDMMYILTDGGKTYYREDKYKSLSAIDFLDVLSSFHKEKSTE